LADLQNEDAATASSAARCTPEAIRQCGNRGLQHATTPKDDEMANRSARRAAIHGTGGSSASRSGSSQFMRQRPLLVVGAGVAFGMALGALLPWSRIEDELLGDQAEKLKDGARELASDGYEKAKSVAQRGYRAASEILVGTEINADSDESGPKGQPSQNRTPATDPYRQ
jgi:ElaB/YqjD/DUF883 family membrane-anchored ribosome-binding protein